MIMNFSIYTLGDVTLFESALKGVAMMFTVASGGGTTLWASNTSLGVGMGAVMGGLIAMIVMIYNGALKRQLDWRALLIPTLLYIALTGPKASVTIYDSYSKEPPRKVDNVPFGLAFPLGTISQLAFSATEKLETVFQVPYAGYSGITQEGYVAPLKMLNALRYTGVAFGGASPDFQSILTNIYTVCLVNNEKFDLNEYNSSLKPFEVLKTALSDPSVSNRGVIMSITGGAGQTLSKSCAESGEFLEKSMKAYVTGSNSDEAFALLTNDELKINNLSRDLDRIMAKQNKGSKQGVSEMSEGKILDTLTRFTTSNNDQIMQFMYGSLINTSLSGVSQCTFDESKTALTKCQSYLTAIEQWKDQSAAEGTGFVTIMKDGQNLLIVLSIILFPIMVLILVIQGASSLKIMGGFILYTVSAFMWLPVASIINFYIHLQLHDEFMKWNPTGDPSMIMTIKNSSGFYDAISQKLALANQALASVPLICMGLFSGMLLTVSRLTDRWNHASNNYDVKVNTPDAVSRSPIVNVASSINFQGLNSVGTINGLSNTFDATASKKLESAVQQVKSAEDQSSLAYQRLFSHELSKSLGKEQLMKVSREAVENYTRGSLTKAQLEKATNDVYEANFGQGTTNTNSSKKENGGEIKTDHVALASDGLKGNLSGTFGFGASDNGKDPDKGQKQKAGFQKGVDFHVGAAHEQKISEAVIVRDLNNGKNNNNDEDNTVDSSRGSYGNAVTVSFGNKEMKSHGFQSVLATELKNAVSERYGSKMTDDKGMSFQKTFSESQDASRSVSESYGLAMNHTRSTGQLLDTMSYSGGLTERMQDAVKEGRKANPEAFDRATQSYYDVLKNSANSLNSEKDLQLIAQFQALKGMSVDGQKLALEAEYGEYNLGSMDNKLQSVRGVVEQGIGNASQQAQEAMNQNYDMTQAVQNVRDQYNTASTQNRVGASQQVQNYTPVGDKYRNQVANKRHDAYDDIVARASDKYGVPEGLIKAIIHTESGFNPNARSPVGAQGLMQLMPNTAKEVNVTNRNDPEQAIMGGTQYIAKQLKKYNGNVDLALAAYNAGGGNVDKYGGVPPFKETKDYINRVKGRYEGLYPNGVESKPK